MWPRLPKCGRIGRPKQHVECVNRCKGRGRGGRGGWCHLRRDLCSPTRVVSAHSSRLRHLQGRSMTIVKNKQGAVIFELDGVDGPDFDSRDLRGHDFTQGVLEGAIFSDANLERTIFREADLYWAVLFRANLRNSILDGALLCGANLKEADLTGASLRGTNLGRDQMGGGTHLQAARLAGADVTGANFEGAEYDFFTTFPDDFDPNEHGMVFAGVVDK